MIYLITENKSEFSHLRSAGIELGDIDDVRSYFQNKEEVQFDTETTGLDPRTAELICAQFGDKDNQFVIDSKTIHISNFKSILENKTILMQFAKFDLGFLYMENIYPNKVYDTFLAESVLSMGDKLVRKGLDVLVDRYTKHTMSKDVRAHIGEGLTERVIKYSAKDVEHLQEIKNAQMVRLTDLNLVRAINLDNKFVKVLAYVEHSGFFLNGKKWKEKMVRDLTNLELAKEALDQWIFDNVPSFTSQQLDMFSEDKICLVLWSSPSQVVKIFKHLGINTAIMDKHSGKNKDSVDAKVLASQSKDFPIIPLFTEYQQQAKLVSTYGDNVLRQIHPTTGRLHTSFKQIMDTGRMSSGETNKKKGIEKLNLQNVPADAAHRGCFMPEDGNKLVVADYSGQESVVFANFSKDPELIEFYQQGQADMHSFIASKIYPELEDITLEEIKSNHKEKRQNAKAAGFAIQYGGTGSTIATNLNLTPEEGEAIYNGYFKAFPGIKKYFAQCKAKALANGYIELNQISYRKSFVDFYEEYKRLKKVTEQDGYWEEYRHHKNNNTEEFILKYKPEVRNYFKKRGQIERKSLNYPIQGSSAEITKFAALKFYDILVRSKLLGIVKICNIVHDEIVVECPEDKAENISFLLQQCMEEAGKPFCKIIPLKAEPCITDHWEH